MHKSYVSNTRGKTTCRGMSTWVALLHRDTATGMQRIHQGMLQGDLVYATHRQGILSMCVAAHCCWPHGVVDSSKVCWEVAHALRLEDMKLAPLADLSTTP